MMAEIPAEVLIALERNATSLAALAELTRTSQNRSERLELAMARQVELLDKMDSALDRMEAEQREGRDAAVRQIIASRKMPQMVGWIIAGACTIIAAAISALAVLHA